MKMEIEFNDEQMEKVETLKSNGISVGEAIDILFDMKNQISDNSAIFIDKQISDVNKQKEELQQKMDEADKKLDLFTKLKDNTLNVEQKQKLVEKEYLAHETYDKRVQDTKHKFKWSKRIFDF